MDIPETLTFFRTFLRHPKDVSSIIPTSARGARAVAERVKPGARCVVVEYGAGVGNVSAVVLRKLGPTDRLILIEKTASLARGLERRFANDPRVTIVCDSAEHVERILRDLGEESVDYALCSIPLSLLPPEVRERVLAGTRRVLTPAGRFIVFLFRPIHGQYLRQHFATVERDVVAWNLPPLWVFEAGKHTPKPRIRRRGCHRVIFDKIKTKLYKKR